MARAHREARRPGSQTPDAVPAREAPSLRVVDAGCSTVLWNSKAPPTDFSTSALRKRRQKLTDDLMKELVGTFGDSSKVVAWWFTVFEFFSDLPVDQPLPSLPASRDNDEDRKRDNEGPRKLATSHLLTGSAALPGSTSGPAVLRRCNSVPCTIGDSDSAASMPDERDLASGAHGISRRLTAEFMESHPSSRPPLVRKTFRQKPDIFHAKKAKFNEDLWRRRKTELRMFRHRTDDCKYDIDLVARTRNEVLDDEKLQVWHKRFTKHQRLNASIYQASLAAARKRKASRESAEAADMSLSDGGDTALARLKRGLGDMLTRAVQKENVAGSSADGDGSEGQSSEHWTDTGAEEANWEASVVEHMLESSSYAMISNKLLKAQHGQQEDSATSTREDIIRERNRILRSIIPIEMTPENLYQAMQYFGVPRKKAVERMYAFLLNGVNSTTKTSGGCGLPFEAFYRLIRALRQPKPKGGKPPKPDATTSGRSVGPHERATGSWNSELLRRLVFAVLTGKSVFRSTLRGANVDRQNEVALSASQLEDALQLMLCTPVLVDVDVGGTKRPSKDATGNGEESNPCSSRATESHPGTGRGGNTAAATGTAAKRPASAPVGGAHTTSDGAPDGLARAMRVPGASSEESPWPVQDLGHESFPVQFRSFAECLHTELIRAEIETSGEEGGASRNVVSIDSFNLFVTEWPGVFVLLLRLLMPLAVRAEGYIAEEMELAAKQLTHVSGELRARMDGQVQRLQRQCLTKLYHEFTVPCRARRAGLS
eukprot:gnl/TRDRNA2_/TRDRNA2_183271_c0_seq1.p1 gnl/TRDRNA2_/TRDRNA2_183271_c0~~gnl/TRDRNA2_/TRDRNA2_183271_c0_seq1.p1  ORF type:complete len:882 (+),score=158.68 gnl/TRDRNA2_/TRDRNA2_183271_c0_seq1:339-2648(+)